MLDDDVLDRVLRTHGHPPGLERVTGWLRPVSPGLRLRALSYYLAGLSPDALCAGCRDAVGFPFAGDPASETGCVRCAALTLAAELDQSERRLLRTERVEVASRLAGEISRGERLRADAARLRAESRRARERRAGGADPRAPGEAAAPPPM